MVTRLEKYLFAAGLMAAIIIGLYIHARISKSDAADRQEATDVKEKAAPALQQDQAVIKSADQDQKATATALTQALAVIAAQKAQPVQPVDYDKIDSMIASHLKEQPAQVKTAVDSTSGQAETTVSTADLRNFSLDYDAETAKLNACSKTNNDLQSKVGALQNQVTTQQTEITKEDQIIKGGTFKHRFATAMKHTVCGAAGAASGVATGQAKVGTAVYGGCELLFWKHGKK